MMNDEDLVKLEQNAFKDSMKDGLVETLAGVIFIMTAFIFNQPAFIGIFVVFYLLFLPRFVEASREKYTYPRIGYVQLRTKESDMDFKSFLLLLLIIIAATGIATQLLTNNIFDPYNWVLFFPFSLGTLLFGPSVYLVEKTGSKSYWLFGTISSILGLVVSYLTIIYPTQSYYDGILAYCMILGTILLCGGLIKFLYFTHTHPVLESQEDDVSEQ
jgi:hypothetical protein